jgi:hypothetical protein
MSWLNIKTAPMDDEMRPFLVLLPKNDVAPFVILQVTPFEGSLYPDHMDGNIDWDDRVTTATHWTPCPALPAKPSKKRARAAA